MRSDLEDMVFIRFSTTNALSITQANKKLLFQNALEVFIYSGAEWCPKHDVTFRFSRNYVLKFPKLQIFSVALFLHWPKKYFFQNAQEIFRYSGAEWCPKHDVTISFSLN